MSFYDLDFQGERVRVEDGEITATDPLLERALRSWLSNNRPGPSDGWPTAAIASRLVSERGAVIVASFDDDAESEPENEDSSQTVY